MDLHTANPYWLLKNGFERTYDVCTEDTKTDAVVMGGGITGALSAYALAKAGLDVVLLEKRHLGMGSTSASTALLQYEIDEPLHSLISMAGRKRAENSYRACYEAIDTLADLVERENIDAGFERVPSLQYASRKKDVAALRKEYEARKKLGFDVYILEPEEIEKRFGFKAPLALYSTKAGQVDAYRLAHGLLGLGLENLRIFDCSGVEELESGLRGVTLKLKNGARVSARKAVVACGYESMKYLPSKVATIGSTFALVTKPLPRERLWEDRALVWETKDPYIYIRTTPDNRVLAGGRDTDYNDARRREKDLPRKIRGLMSDLGELFPDLGLQADFAWAGAFASTKDSLGYAGGIKERPNVYFNLGFGGNGILYSQIGAEVIRDKILGRKHQYDDTFEFGR